MASWLRVVLLCLVTWVTQVTAQQCASTGSRCRSNKPCCSAADTCSGGTCVSGTPPPPSPPPPPPPPSPSPTPPAPPPPTLPCGATVLSNNFDQYPGAYQSYTQQLWQADFPRSAARPGADGVERQPGYRWFAAGGELRADVGEGLLRTTMPEGCVGTAECGLQFDVRLLEPLAAATFSYQFRFEQDYAWTSGGKLPGVCSEDRPAGCIDELPNGFNSRVMWRDFGELESYMYFPGKTARCGDMWTWDINASFEWHEVKVYVQMNDPGQANGVQTTWLDGAIVDDRSDITFRTDFTAAIEFFTFRNFHGGSTDLYRPPKTQYMWFDDLAVQQGRCPPA